jgi:flagellar biogenesis protein FliO
MTRRTLLLFAALFFSFAGLAIAGEAAVPAQTFEGPSLGSSLMRVMGALILVFTILFGGVWLARNSRKLISPNARAIKLSILEVKSLGQRQALYVVAYEQQRMLVASSPTGVALLTHLPSADASEPVQTRTVPSFAEVLIQTVTRKS